MIVRMIVPCETCGRNAMLRGAVKEAGEWTWLFSCLERHEMRVPESQARERGIEFLFNIQVIDTPIGG